MLALGDDPAAVEDENPIGVADRREAMRDDDGGTPSERGAPDLVALSGAQEAGYRFIGAETPHAVAKVGHTLDPKEAHGEFVGLAMFSKKGARALTDAWAQLHESRREAPFHEAPSLLRASFPDLVQELVDRGQEVQAIDVYKGWLEIDTFEDYRRAWALIKE